MNMNRTMTGIRYGVNVNVSVSKRLLMEHEDAYKSSKRYDPDKTLIEHYMKKVGMVCQSY